MQQDWRDFLQERANATGSAAPANGSYLTDLAELALIRVAGADATAFLQAQLSNDLIRVGGATSQLSSWCDAKGRVLATLRIFKREDAYLLLLPAQLSDSVCKRLKMFVLRSKVEVSDVSDALPRFALFGPDTEQLLQKTHAAPGNDEVLEIEGTQCLRLPGETPSYIFVGDSNACQKLWASLDDEAVTTPFERWQRDQILAGQPQVFANTQGEFVPQMLNLHWIGGVDFKKGCYPGQEVVARLQYRGKLKRRMFLAELESTDTPAPGTVISTPNDTNVGQVVMAAQLEKSQQVLLAVLKIDAAANAMLGEQPLKLQELPYPTPD